MFVKQIFLRQYEAIVAFSLGVEVRILRKRASGQRVNQRTLVGSTHARFAFARGLARVAASNGAILHLLPSRSRVSNASSGRKGQQSWVQLPGFGLAFQEPARLSWRRTALIVTRQIVCAQRSASSLCSFFGTRRSFKAARGQPGSSESKPLIV